MDIIQAKTYVPKQGDKCLVIHITDISFHVTEKRQTSIGLEIGNALEKGVGSRIFVPLKNNPSLSNSDSIVEFLQKDPSFIKMIKEKQEEGYRILINIPKGGVPIITNKDTDEFINSKNGKRIIRGLAKNN